MMARTTSDTDPIANIGDDEPIICQNIVNVSRNTSL
jgi:hypothetical protein